MEVNGLNKISLGKLALWRAMNLKKAFYRENGIVNCLIEAKIREKRKAQ